MSIFLDYTECETGLKYLTDIVSKTVDPNNGEEVAEMVAILVGIQGYSATLMASCEYLSRSHKTNAEYKAMFTLAERLNNTVGKSISGLQSLLGKLKSELDISKFAT